MADGIVWTSGIFKYEISENRMIFTLQTCRLGVCVSPPPSLPVILPRLCWKLNCRELSLGLPFIPFFFSSFTLVFCRSEIPSGKALFFPSLSIKGLFCLDDNPPRG